MVVKCKRCNRPLKNPESIKLGYGITCAKKEKIIIPRKQKKEKDRPLNHSIFNFGNEVMEDIEKENGN